MLVPAGKPQHLSTSKYVRNNMIVEWYPGYINYPEIKQILKTFKIMTIIYKKFQHSNGAVHPVVQHIPAQQKEILVKLGSLLETLVRLEYRKFDAFAQFKIFELYANWRQIEECWMIFKNVDIRSHTYSHQRKSLKKAIQICYQNISYAKSFVVLNQQVVKILGEKIETYVYNFYEFPKHHCNSFISRNQLAIDNLGFLVQDTYTQSFCSVNNKHKITDLIINKNKITKGKEYFFLGLFLGFVIFLLFTMAMTLILNLVDFDFDSTDSQSLKYVFPMFRGVALFILYMWGLAWNVYGFTRFNINYRLILKFDDNHYSTYGQIMKRAGFFTVLLLLMFLLYLMGKSYSIKYKTYLPVEYTPFVVMLVFFSYIFFPSEYVFNPKGRKYFYKVLTNIIISPIIPMSFLIAWSTDQMVSFVGPLKDLAYSICYYTSDFSTKELTDCLSNSTIAGVTIGYVVALVPLAFRMVQCYRQAVGPAGQGKFIGHIQMWNFLKYFSSVSTATFSFLSKFRKDLIYGFIASSIISTCYAYYWDLKHDWGFLQAGSKNKLLRDSLSYKSPNIYYLAIVINFVLRCAWTLTISSFVINKLDSTFLVFVTSLLEMFRRCMWNFFRIQKEHIINCSQFRTTEDSKTLLKEILDSRNNIQPGQIRRRPSEDSDVYSRIDNDFEVREQLASKENLLGKHKHTYSVVMQSNEEIVKKARENFERIRAQSEKFLSGNEIEINISELYKKIGLRKLTMVQASKHKTD